MQSCRKPCLVAGHGIWHLFLSSWWVFCIAAEISGICFDVIPNRCEILSRFVVHSGLPSNGNSCKTETDKRFSQKRFLQLCCHVTWQRLNIAGEFFLLRIYLNMWWDMNDVCIQDVSNFTPIMHIYLQIIFRYLQTMVQKWPFHFHVWSKGDVSFVSV